MEDYIYLEPDEEIPSIVKKLKAAQSGSVGLVVPRGSIMLQSTINLKLLKKEAAKLSKDIAIVTADGIGQHLAAQAGLTVYESAKSTEPIAPAKPPSGSRKISEPGEPAPDGVTVRHFQTEEIKPEKEFVEPQKTQAIAQPVTSRRSRLPLYLVIAIALAVLYTFVVPRAIITMTVLGEPFSKELTLKTATVSSGDEPIIPSTFEEEAKLATKNVKTTGQKDVGEKAKGEITLSNAWSSDPVSLASGTKLTKDGQAFHLAQAAVIPGASVTLIAGQAQTNPGQVKATIEAEQAGDKGNVAAGKFTITTIEAAKQSKIFGETAAKLTGGSSKFLTVVSGEDIKNARAALAQQAKSELKDELAKKVAGRIILDQATKVESQDERLTKKEGDEAADFDISAKVSMKAIVFTEEDFRKAFLRDLQHQVGDAKEIVFGANDEIITTVEAADFENGRMTIKGLLKSQIAPKLDQAALKQELRFKSIPGAMKILQAQPHVDGVEIAIVPSFALKRIPLLPTNIKFDIKHK